MKRLIVLLVLFPLINCFLFAYDGYGSPVGGTINMGLSTLYMANPDSSELDRKIPLHPLTFSSVFVGFGGHLNVIPNIFAPGLYGDLHFSLISLLIDWLDGDDSLYNNDFPLFFQAGIRLYNQFRISSICIQPFLGLNALGVLAATSGVDGYKAAGILIAFNSVGIEYSYQVPLFHRVNNTSRAIHRWALVFRSGAI